MCFIIVENEQNNNSKCSTFASSVFCTFFHFKLCSFCWRGRKNISRPQAQDALATPLSMCLNVKINPFEISYYFLWYRKVCTLLNCYKFMTFIPFELWCAITVARERFLNRGENTKYQFRFASKLPITCISQ